MEYEELKVLDTSTFSSFLASRDKWIKDYQKIQTEYNQTIEELRKKWTGSGADAFMHDVEIIQLNLAGMKDILEIMCDTLEDCYQIFEECDKTLGELNRGAAVE